MRTIPSDPFICLLPSECLQNNGKGTNRKVVDRSHLPHLLLQERHYTGVLLGLISAFYCPLCTHGSCSLVSNTFLAQESRNVGAFTPCMVSVTLRLVITFMRCPEIFTLKIIIFQWLTVTIWRKAWSVPIVFTLLPGIGRARYCWV